MKRFTKQLRTAALGALIAVPLVGVPAAAQQATQQPAPAKHHSKVKGAIVGAVAGHAMGGHAKAGAVAGALVQHHRNSKAKKAVTH